MDYAHSVAINSKWSLFQLHVLKKKIEMFSSFHLILSLKVAFGFFNAADVVVVAERNAKAVRYIIM